MRRTTLWGSFVSSLVLCSLACGGAESPGTGTGGQGGGDTPEPCNLDALVAQPWSAKNDACVVQQGVAVCSTYRFRFDGTWQKDTSITDTTTLTSTNSPCTIGSWSQTTCGVLDVEDCNHTRSQMTWSVTGSGQSATATLNGGTYRADATATFSDCVPAVCPDAPKNTDGFVGTWAVSTNNVTVTCSGTSKPNIDINSVVWQRGTTSDLVAQDGPCTWQLNVQASTFSLPATQMCSDSTTGATWTYSRYDGALDSPTTASVAVIESYTVRGSASSPAIACSLQGTLKLTKSSN